jgi:hypothetical protein
MKKSQLRKIIRESIKELMNEQGSTPPCQPSNGGIITINGDPATNPGACCTNITCHHPLYPTCIINSNVQNAFNSWGGYNGVVAQWSGSTFENNMSNLYNNQGCSGIQNKAQQLYQQEEQLANGWTNGAMCAGDNPAWQMQLLSKRVFLYIEYYQTCISQGVTFPPIYEQVDNELIEPKTNKDIKPKANKRASTAEVQAFLDQGVPKMGIRFIA